MNHQLDLESFSLTNSKKMKVTFVFSLFTVLILAYSYGSEAASIQDIEGLSTNEDASAIREERFPWGAVKVRIFHSKLILI